MRSVTLPIVGSRLRILLIDDELALASALARGLERLDFSTHVLSTAAAGIAVLSRETFDVVLSDMNLEPPEMGDEFLRRVKVLAPNAFRIVYSGRRLTDASFADASLEKPCTAQDIRALIEAWLIENPRP